MPAPHPSENAHWPAWFYPSDTDPENPTAKGKVFQQAEDVPEGWLHHWSLHGSNLEREPPAAPAQRLTRSELRTELTKRDVPWLATAGAAELQKLLDEAVAAEAEDAQV